MPANPSTVRFSLATPDPNGIAEAQAVAAAGDLTINGALASGGVATLDVARRVVAVSSNAADTTQTATVYGTDRNGNVQSEAVTLNGVTDVFTGLDFLTVTRVAVSAALAGNITVGTNGVGSTEWQICNFWDWVWCLSIGCIGQGSTVYSVQHTYDDPNQPQTNMPQGFSIHPGSNVPALAWDNPIINSVTGTNEVRYADWPIFAFRLIIESGTDEVMMQAIQAGRGSGGA